MTFLSCKNTQRCLFSIYIIDILTWAYLNAYLFDFYFIKTVSFSDAVGVPDVLLSHNFYIDEI